MKKSYNVRLSNVLSYTVILFLSNYIAYLISTIVVGKLFLPIADKIPFAITLICVFLIYILIGLFIPLFAVFFFFRVSVMKQYIPSDDKYFWVRNCVRFILPAEIIRFLFCQVTLGQINVSGYFAYLPTFIFEITYLNWTNRYEQVRQKFLEYNFADFTAYAICYLIYLAVHLLFVMIIYRRFWFEAKKDKDDLIVHE